MKLKENYMFLGYYLCILLSVVYVIFVIFNFLVVIDVLVRYVYRRLFCD